MTQSSYPWTSVGGDRQMSAGDYAAFLSATRSNVVLSGLEPTKDGSTVDVAAGTAIINGRVYVNTATETLTPSAGNRKDYIVLRLDATARSIELDVLEGTDTVFPTLTRDASVWELAIASIDNSAGLFTVVDTRNDFTLCGVQDTGVLTSGLFSARSGWSITAQSWRRVGDLVMFRVSGTRTGTDINVTQSRGSVNQDVLNITLTPEIGIFVPGLVAGGSATFQASTGSTLQLSAVALQQTDTTSPWTAIANGDSFFASGSFFV